MEEKKEDSVYSCIVSKQSIRRLPLIEKKCEGKVAEIVSRDFGVSQLAEYMQLEFRKLTATSKESIEIQIANSIIPTEFGWYMNDKLRNVPTLDNYIRGLDIVEPMQLYCSKPSVQSDNDNNLLRKISLVNYPASEFAIVGLQAPMFHLTEGILNGIVSHYSFAFEKINVMFVRKNNSKWLHSISLGWSTSSPIGKTSDAIDLLLP